MNVLLGAILSAAATPAPGWSWSPGIRDAQTQVLAIADLNGDGRDDLVVGWYQPGGGAVGVFHGGPGGLPAEPDVQIDAPEGEAFFWPSGARSLGDVNGDGADDLVVSDGGYLWSMSLILGSPGALVVDTRWHQEVGNIVGHAVRVGDVDGDGFADLAVPTEGALWIFAGGPDGPSLAPTWTVTTSGPPFGAPEVVGLGDRDGDGDDEFLVVENLYTSLVRAFDGTPAGPSAILEVRQAIPGLGTSAVLVDLDCDGIQDLVLGHPGIENGGGWFAHRGIPGGFDSQWFASGLSPRVARLGDTMGVVGDADGDGRADVLMGAPSFGAADSPKGAFVLVSATSPLTTSTWAEGEIGGFAFGGSLELGDLDGDGRTDLATSQRLWRDTESHEGRVQVFFGVGEPPAGCPQPASTGDTGESSTPDSGSDGTTTPEETAPPGDPPAAESEGCGCADVGPAGAGWVVFALASLVSRRRRSGR